MGHYTAADQAQMVAAYRETGSIRRAAAITGTSFGAVKRAILKDEPDHIADASKMVDSPIGDTSSETVDG